MRFEVDLSEEELDAFYFVVRGGVLAVMGGLAQPRPEHEAMRKILVAANYNFGKHDKKQP